jgi:sec-independent protein translocase protein TatB
MFDISWTEFLLIGVVALIVIGPKELPSVLRTLGQWTRKVRGMAADFQGQFQEAMREAEMADLKKEVDDVAQSLKDGIKNFDPLKDVRTDVEAAGKDIQASLEKPALMTAATEAAGEANGQDVVAAATAPVAPETVEPTALELPAPVAGAEPGEQDAVAAATGPVVPQPADEAAPPETTGHGG